MSSTNAIPQQESRESVSMAVVHAVTDETGVSPVDVRPLYHVIDPDALDRFVDSLSTAGDGPIPSISFRYADCDVTVYADETVSVNARD